MDIFGIGTRILNSIHEHARMARGTGRSHVLSDMVQPGDAIVFATNEQMREFLDLQVKRNRTLQLRTYVSDPKLGLVHLERTLWAGIKHNRVFFDHVWLEEYYALQMSDIVRKVSVTAQMYSKGPEL